MKNNMAWLSVFSTELSYLSLILDASDSFSTISIGKYRKQFNIS